MRVSLFADAQTDQVQWARDTGCDRIELYTGPYGGTYADEAAKRARSSVWEPLPMLLRRWACRSMQAMT